MSYNTYDDWKLANPWDDGHYGEEDNIATSIYYKHSDLFNKYWHYGMITTGGQQISIHRYHGMASIGVDTMDNLQENADNEIIRIRANYKRFEFIEKDEFLEAFRDAQNQLNNLVDNESNY